MDDALRQLLNEVGQGRLVARADRLSGGVQAAFVRQLSAIDWRLYARLKREHAAGESDPTSSKGYWRDLATRSTPPPAIRLGDQEADATRGDAVARGEAMLRSGKVAMILVAGGLGTRLGFDRPKGMFDLGPVSNRSLFQMLIDRLRAVGLRYGKPVPLYIMTSPATHQPTLDYLASRNWFGLAPGDVRLFQQGTFYAVDEQTFDVLCEADDRLFTGPDGHGGMLEALERSGCLAEAKARGVETFFYGQIDNPLLTICDPEFLGRHTLANSELTSQAVAKTDPSEKVGVFVEVDGAVRVIEYVDLPDQVAAERDATGALRIWAGSVAVHAFQRSFLERMAQSANDVLPLHVSKKKVPFVDDQGTLVTPSRPNALRFERFIFDLLPHAKNALVVEIDKAVGFAPVKNEDAAGVDTPTASRAAIVALARNWLEAAGVQVAPGTSVEISPLWALDALELARKVKRGTIVDRPTFFE